MATAPKTYSRNLDREALISEANGTMSREQVMLYRGAKIAPNTVMAMITASKLWVPLNLAGADGSQTAAGVLLDGRNANTTADTRRAVVVVRDADFNGKKLVWPAGITGPQKTTALAQLGATNILVRS